MPAVGPSADDFRNNQRIRAALFDGDAYASRAFSEDVRSRVGDGTRTHDFQIHSVPATRHNDNPAKVPADGPSTACTPACTNAPKKGRAIDLDALAVILLDLPKEDRMRLLAKLLGQGEGKTGAP